MDDGHVSFNTAYKNCLLQKLFTALQFVLKLGLSLMFFFVNF